MNPSLNPAQMASDTTLALAARLQRHPELEAQVTALLDEVENRAGTLNTGDDAEDAIVARLRQLGGQALIRWAEQRHAAVQPAPTPGLRRVGKKNSAGKPPSAPLG
jgi:hypothetical protein